MRGCCDSRGLLSRAGLRVSISTRTGLIMGNRANSAVAAIGDIFLFTGRANITDGLICQIEPVWFSNPCA